MIAFNKEVRVCNPTENEIQHGFHLITSMGQNISLQFNFSWMLHVISIFCQTFSNLRFDISITSSRVLKLIAVLENSLALKHHVLNGVTLKRRRFSKY